MLLFLYQNTKKGLFDDFDLLLELVNKNKCQDDFIKEDTIYFDLIKEMGLEEKYIKIKAYQ